MNAVMPTLVLTERMLTHWRRHPLIPLQALALPTLLLLIYHLVVAKSMARLTGADNLAALVPMCTVAGAMMAALGVGFHIVNERNSGLLSRLWVLPVHRSSFVAGALLAEAVRTLAAGAVILGVGIALGLRLQGGWLSVLVFLMLPVLVVLVFASIVISVAVRTHSSALLTLLGTVAIGLAFCTGGIAPVELFPTWLQPVIRMQPLTPIIDSMQALALGDDARPALLAALAWVVGLGAVFGPLAVRAYRSAAQSGGTG